MEAASETADDGVLLAEDEVVLGDGDERLPARIPSGTVVAAVAWPLYAVIAGVLMGLVSRSADGWRQFAAVAVSQAAFWAAATPAVVWLARWIERRGIRLPVALAIHAVAAALATGGIIEVRLLAASLVNPSFRGRFVPQALFWLDVHVLTYATIVIVARTLDLHRRYRDRALRAHRLELTLARAQMQFLELQLQPHFLFNCLNAVSELAYEAPDAAVRMLRQLRALLHVSLDRAGRDEVTLDEELAGLEPYVEIQRARFSDWLTVRQAIDPLARDALVPHLILQPLVENAIRHGLAVRSAPGSVVITAEIHEGTLRLSVRDDGVGLGPAASSRRPGLSGIGLRNTRDRLRQLYDPDYRFALRAASEGGTIVELDVPLRRRDVTGRAPALPGERHSRSSAWREQTEQRSAVSSAPRTTPITASRGGLSLVPSGDADDTPFPRDDVAATLVTGGWAAARRPEVPPALERQARPATTPDDETVPVVRLTPRLLAGFAGGWLLVGLVWTLQISLLGFAALGHFDDEQTLLRINMIAAAQWAILTPLVLWLAHRFRIAREYRLKRLLIHFVAAFVIATIHVAVYSLIETHELSLFVAGNQNQLTGNLFIYFGLVAWAHARQFYAWYREREVVGSRIQVAIARSRYQALCVQLRPQLLLGTLERLEGLVREDVPRAERLIARLGDVLRLTLDGASDQTTTIRKELDLLRAYADVYQLGMREGVRLEVEAPPALLGLTIPNRLLRTIADDLLGPVLPGADALLTVEVDRELRATRVRIHLDAPAARGTTQQGGPWTASVEAASLAEVDRRVSLYFPDSRTALVVLADEVPAELATRARASKTVPAA